MESLTGIIGVALTAVGMGGGALWAMGRRESKVDTSLGLLREEVSNGHRRTDERLRDLSDRLNTHQAHDTAEHAKIEHEWVHTNTCAARHEAAAREADQVLKRLDRLQETVDGLPRKISNGHSPS